jgi:uncharacterized protein (DUF433 family)
MDMQRETRERYSPAQVAALLGLSQKDAFRVIDEIPAEDRSKEKPRSLTREQLLFLVSLLEARRDVRLPEETKRTLYEDVVRRGRRRKEKVRVGIWSLDLRGPRRELTTRLARYRRARKVVSQRKDIRGGEPVIRGTRISVYQLADMLEAGATKEEILAGYPTLDREKLDLALLYARAHPRRGRPPKHPWH